jgi:ribosomal protein S18
MLSHRSCKGVSPELQRHLAGAVKLYGKSCKGVSPCKGVLSELQSCMAEAAKVSHRSCKGVSLELQKCLAGVAKLCSQSCKQ